MGIYRAIKRRLAEWRKPAPAPVDVPQEAPVDPLIHALIRMVTADIGRVNDGLEYIPPILLTEEEQQRLQQSGQWDQFLEDARATYRFQFDTPQRGSYDAPFMPPFEDPLKEWTWSTRKSVLSTCHAFYARNPLANTAVQYTADFIIGDGFNLTCKNKKAQEFLDAFMDNPRNRIREYERQAVIDLQVDGELFLRFFTQAGDVVAVPMRPWEVWRITTEPGFFRDVVSYDLQWNKEVGDTGQQETARETIPADNVLHAAINKHAYELRGRPELYRILPWLRADKEFLENRARQNHYRDALMWHVQLAGATPASMAVLASQFSKPPTPGSIVTTTDKVKIDALNNPVRASDAGEDGRQIKLRNIMGLRLPEYMFGDGYNANLATATAQEFPAMTKFSAFRTIMIEQLWYPLFRRVLQEAVDEGLLPMECEEQYADGDIHYEDDGVTPCMCETVKSFEVSYSPTSNDDLLSVTQALVLQRQQDWIDDQTAMEKLGNDPHMVQKRLEDEEDEEEEDIAQGKIPSPGGVKRPIGMDGEPEDMGDGEDMPGMNAPANAAQPMDAEAPEGDDEDMPPKQG